MRYYDKCFGYFGGILFSKISKTDELLFFIQNQKGDSMYRESNSFIEADSTEVTSRDLELVEPLSKENKLRTMVNSKKARLGMWNEFLYSKEQGILLREQMGEIFSILIEAQKDEIAHRLTLDNDLQKKHSYALYQQSVDKLNKTIIEESEKMADELTKILQESKVQIFKRRKETIESIAQMLKDGLIDKEEYLEEETEAKSWSRKNLNTVIEKIDLMFQSQAKTLKQTLELLDQRAAT